MVRKFEIIDFPQVGCKYGSYTSNTPGQAASKAFSALVKKMRYNIDDKEKFIIFSLKEQSGSVNGGKIYEYVGTRVKLHKPIRLGSREYNYRNIVVSHKDQYFS